MSCLDCQWMFRWKALHSIGHYRNRGTYQRDDGSDIIVAELLDDNEARVSAQGNRDHRHTKRGYHDSHGDSSPRFVSQSRIHD